MGDRFDKGNFFYMRNIILVLFLIIAGVHTHAADSAASRVLNHRNWMKTGFPGKDSSLEKKMEGVADILDFDLQEIEALALMEYLRADCKDFMPYPPDLEKYLRNHGSNVVDDLGKFKRAAVGYFTEFSKYKLGTFHPVSVRLRLLQIDLENQYHYMGEMATAFADSLHVNSRQNPARINQVMHVFADLQAFLMRNAYKMATAPEDILEIMKLEDDVLSIFPPKSEEKSLWRANAYLMIGDIKGLINDGEQFDVTVMGTKYQMDVIPDNGTEYSSLGVNRDVTSNAPWYFIKAEEIVENIYSPNHPATNIFVYRAQSFMASNYAIDSELADGLKDTYTYFKLYYPENNLNALCVRMNS